MKSIDTAKEILGILVEHQKKEFKNLYKDFSDIDKLVSNHFIPRTIEVQYRSNTVKVYLDLFYERVRLKIDDIDVSFPLSTTIYNSTIKNYSSLSFYDRDDKTTLDVYLFASTTFVEFLKTYIDTMKRVIEKKINYIQKEIKEKGILTSVMQESLREV